jgi:dCMP deaminase
VVSERIDWTTYFLAIAQTVSLRADCTRRQVGCVLVDVNHRIIATGYNGAPPGEPGCASERACPRGQQGFDVVPARSQYREGVGRCIAIHAEDNAVRYASGWRELSGATAYITSEPCDPCRALLKDVGVRNIIWAPGG